MALEDPASGARAFDAAARADGGRLFSVAYAILRDVREAEDAVQETMELAWKSWDSLREPSKRSAWLRQICIRQALRMRRRLRLRLWLADDPKAQAQPDRDPDPDLDLAFRRLSRRQRAVVALHYQYGYSLDECAALIGCRPGTARSHLNRALTRMRKELGYE